MAAWLRMEPIDLVNHLFTPAGRDDPYPIYERLRAFGPITTVQPEFLITTSHPVINSLLRDSRMAVPEEGPRLKSSLLTSNPPDHTRLRRLMAGTFTPKRINGLAAAIESQAHELADRMREGEQADLMADFAYRLPVWVICELLGVPISDREWFRPVASDFAVVLEGTMTEAEDAAATTASDLLRAYFADLVRAKRGTPGNDLISDLAVTDDIADPELLSNLALLLVAGFETTTNLIGNGVRILFDHPEQGKRLQDDPGLVEGYVEEFLRYDSPVQLTSRIATDPIEIEGTTIEPGTYVMTLIGAANRDPDRFELADQFHPERANAPLSFGAGAHFCLGAALARLEARIAFPLLFQRFPGLTPAAPPVRRDRLVLRGYESMPVTW